MQPQGYAARPQQLAPVTPGPGQSLEPQRCISCGLGWPIAHFSRNADGTRDLSRKLCQRCGEPDKERIRWQKMKGRMLKRRNDARNMVKANILAAYMPSPAYMYIPQRPRAPAPKPSQAQVPQVAAPRPPEPPKAAAPPQPPAPQPLLRRNMSDRRQVCLSSLDYLPEPTRAHAWINTFFAPDPLSNVNQIDVFTRYQKDFAEHPVTTLPGVDFINLIPQVYPSVRLTDLRGAKDQPGHFICIGFKEKPIDQIKLSNKIASAAAALSRPTRPQPSALPSWSGAPDPSSQSQAQASIQSAPAGPAQWETQQAALAAHRRSQAHQTGYIPQAPRSAPPPGWPSVLLPPMPPTQPGMTYVQPSLSQSRPFWAVGTSSQGHPGHVPTGMPQSAPMGRPPSTQSEWAFLLDQRRGPDPTPQLSQSAERVITDMAVIPRRSAPTTPRSMSLARQSAPHDIIEID